MRTLGQGTVRLIHHLLRRFRVATTYSIHIVRVCLIRSGERKLPLDFIFGMWYPFFKGIHGLRFGRCIRAMCIGGL